MEKYGENKELYEDIIANKSEITKSLIQKLILNSKITIQKIGNNFKFIGVWREKLNILFIITVIKK